jgi:hypothetical protein
MYSASGGLQSVSNIRESGYTSGLRTLIGVAGRHPDIPDIASLDDIVQSLHLRAEQCQHELSNIHPRIPSPRWAC